MDPTTRPADRPVIERSVRIEADPATVYRYWIDPELLVRWMGRSAVVEPRLGGMFRVDYNGTDVARGTFLEVVPPERLVLTWGWEAEGDSVPPEASRVEVTFVPDGDATVVTVRHLELPEGALEGHAIGWDQFLPQLAGAVSDR